MRRGRHTLAMLLGVVVSLTFASAAQAEEDFTISPLVANPGQEITVTPLMTAVEEATISAVGFQFEDEAPVMDTAAPFAGATHTYATAGVKTVSMHIVPLVGETRVVDKTIRINAAPVAGFTRNVTVPNVGQSVRFDAGATTDDAALPNSAYEWDFDNNGTYEQVGQVVQRSFATPGDKTVRLRVTDSGNRTGAATAVVHVNRPPVAALTFSPRTPQVGQTIAFTSVSDDPDNPISLEEWDLDGDGQYDDARGSEASRAFSSSGNHTVRLRVRDTLGRTDAVAVSLSVAALPKFPLRRMRPWPELRIVGFAGARRVRVDLFTVTTIAGATVKVRCAGRGCPRRTAVSTRARRPLVRLRSLERRLPAGTHIYVAITFPGTIGRYERILLRRKKKPLRRMSCLYPNDPKPRKC